MAKAALPLFVDPDILTYAALEIAIEGIVDQVDNMNLDVDADERGRQRDVRKRVRFPGRRRSQA
jgi:hypothetical protein